VLSGRGLCDELITRPEESYRLCCVVVCDLETSRIGAPYIYIYDISSLRVNTNVVINLLKLSSHVMRQQVDIQQLCTLSTLYLFVMYLSENKQRIVPLTA